MKILIHGINFPPELTGVGKYTGEMVEWLINRGHDVMVITAPPYYPQWRVVDGYANMWSKEIRTTTSGNLVVYRCPLWVPSKPSGLKRLMHLASFALSSFFIMMRQVLWYPNIVWVVEPPLLCAPCALQTARMCGAKTWLHVQDFEVDAAFALGLLSSGWGRRMAMNVEGWLMRRFDRVSTISDNMLKRLKEKGVSNGVLFPNWMDLTELKAGDVDSKLFRAELEIANEAVVALYSGNMGKKQGLEVLADVAKQLSQKKDASNLQSTILEYRPEVVFVFCGNGSGRSDLEARCSGLSNVRFLDLQPVEKFKSLLAMGDIHLLPQRSDAADLVMPSKLTGMFASAKPVVATVSADTQIAAVVAGRGLIVPPGDSAALADAILELADNPAERIRLGRAGRDYAVAHWNRESVLVEFERELTELSTK